MNKKTVSEEKEDNDIERAKKESHMCFSFLVGIVRALYHTLSRFDARDARDAFSFALRHTYVYGMDLFRRATEGKKAHIVLALTSINAYISEEHQLHFSFMSPLFLPH